MFRSSHNKPGRNYGDTLGRNFRNTLGGNYNTKQLSNEGISRVK